jgi:putative nucleotidyltransferase with HDIG domain
MRANYEKGFSRRFRMLYQLNLRELTYVLSEALDYVGIDDIMHGKRVAYIACELGKTLGWRQSKLDKVMLMAMLHDSGVSSTDVHHAIIHHLDWSEAHTHCTKGALLLKSVPIYRDFADIIAQHHTHWEHFSPHLDEEVKLYANLIYLSDRIDSLRSQFGAHLYHEKEYIRSIIQKHTPTMFSPQLTEAFVQISQTDAFWYYLEPEYIHYYFRDWIDKGEIKAVSFDLLKKIALMFAGIVDDKGVYTHEHHTLGVASLARYLAQLCELSLGDQEMIELAALFHDLGKLRIPDDLVCRVDALNDDECIKLRRHGFDAQIILQQIKGFEGIAKIVSMHHETLDAKGYPAHLGEEKIPLKARILSTADTFEDLMHQTKTLDAKNAYEMLEKMVIEHKLDASIVDKMAIHMQECYEKAIHPHAYL